MFQKSQWLLNRYEHMENVSNLDVVTSKSTTKEKVNNLLKYQNGILSAPTGFGKTVIAAYIIAKLHIPTLVIVPKTALIAQWVDRLQNFLTIKEQAEPLLTPSVKQSKRKRHVIGQIGGGRQKSINHKVHLLVGEGTARMRRERLAEAIEEIKDMPSVIVATESYLGEGFDASSLNTLFLSTPISWDGNVIQQAGRLHRTEAGKTEVKIYDYVDSCIPMFDRMYKKRLKTYAKLGYEPYYNDTSDIATNNTDTQQRNADFVCFDESTHILLESMKTLHRLLILLLLMLHIKHLN